MELNPASDVRGRGGASPLPCYTEALVERQRGWGVYANSIRALKRLNALGYGNGETKLNSTSCTTVRAAAAHCLD